MPNKLLPACRIKGCKNRAVSNSTLCLEHLKKFQADDLKRRTDLSDPFYRSRAWKNIRSYILTTQPLCRICGSPATCVDHIKRIREGADPYDITNLQPLCDHCHAIKRGQERQKSWKYK